MLEKYHVVSDGHYHWSIENIYQEHNCMKFIYLTYLIKITITLPVRKLHQTASYSLSMLLNMHLPHDPKISLHKSEMKICVSIQNVFKQYLNIVSIQFSSFQTCPLESLGSFNTSLPKQHIMKSLNLEPMLQIFLKLLQ